MEIQDIFSHPYVIDFLKLAGLTGISVLGYFCSKKWILPVFHGFIKRTRFTWDDYLGQYKVLDRILLLLPALIFHYGLALVPDVFSFLSRLILIYLCLVVISILNGLIDTLVAVYNSLPLPVKWPIKGWSQLIKLFLSIIGAIFVVALLIDRSPWGLVSGIGALTAIILLIFKDTLLSFVASIQIASYDLIRQDDWIEMPAFSADGNVIDMSLHTVKVKNFDNTIVSIPTHKFLDNSFRNWRGMFETGCRRIKRAVLIDQTSVAHLEPEAIERLMDVDLLRPYLEAKTEEIGRCHREKGISPDNPLNGRRLTNLGTFRAYVEAYLKRHPHVSQDKTLMVRHLAPAAEKGLPVEIYCFASDTRWVSYEAIQADIFDHILAALPFFGLRAYQRNALVDGRSRLELGHFQASFKN